LTSNKEKSNQDIDNEGIQKMKTLLTLKLARALFVAAGGIALLAPTLHAAAPFTYNDGDVILAFRQPGGPAPDLVVNLGSATNLDAVPLGSTITLANLSVSQLNSAFVSLNQINWSVSAATRTPTTPYTQNSIWVTARRTNNTVVSSPWFRKVAAVQASAVNQIVSVGQNAATYGSLNPAGPDNTATGVIIPFTDPNAYSKLIVDPVNANVHNFAGTFGSGYGPGDVENTTPANFVSAQLVSRADFYQLTPGATAISRLVGYFDFKADGTLTFTAGVPPSITGINRDSGTGITTVSFTTINSPVNYSLRYTNSAGLGAPPATWAVAPGVLVGNGLIRSLTATNADDNAFYRVTAY